jgi:hypothetical protein
LRTTIDRDCRFRSNAPNLTKETYEKSNSAVADRTVRHVRRGHGVAGQRHAYHGGKNAWQNIKDKKWDDFKKIFSADFRGVYATGINKLDKEITEVKTLDLKSYSLGDIDVVFIDKDAALLAYPVTFEGSKDGKDASGKMNAASIWKKEGNDWRCVFHTDMKVE